MKEKTAVEWLVEQLMPKVLTAEQYYHIEKAKEMEKEQIIDTWNNAINAVEKDKWESFEQYYQKTFKSE
jgi:hypothetical protein